MDELLFHCPQRPVPCIERVMRITSACPSLTVCMKFGVKDGMTVRESFYTFWRNGCNDRTRTNL